jgi:hypothetical protein
VTLTVKNEKPEPNEKLEMLARRKRLADRRILVRPYMIKPMMRSGTEGYVPLCSVLYWIMTEAGKEPERLENIQLWEAAIRRLFPLIESGEVQIVGRDIDAQTKPIDGVIFASISFGHPLRGGPGLILGGDPWISFALYVDDEYWKGGFNDCLYLRKGGPVSWTHLQVRKADVLRHITFDAAKRDVLAMPDESTSPALQQQIREAKSFGQTVTCQQGQKPEMRLSQHGFLPTIELLLAIERSAAP